MTGREGADGERHRVASTDELAEEGSRVLVEVAGREVGVFNVGGELHAVANYCVHQAGPLCEGDLTGRMVIGDDGWEWLWDDDRRLVTCPWHGWKFDVTTGANVQDDRYRVPRYDVEVEDGAVFVRF